MNTPQDRLLRMIARRAIDTIQGLRAGGVTATELRADIVLCHAICPLRLQALLSADAFAFASEITAIRRHLDRANRALTGGFVPRFRDSRAARAA